MKTSAVIILVIGAVSLVGGVVALTLPYTGYPWLRHSGRVRKLPLHIGRHCKYSLARKMVRVAESRNVGL